MNKSDLCQSLFDDIKDDIEFDSDVLALESLLLVMLDIDINISFRNWKYLILKYDINSLKYNIDFEPLVKIYPEVLFNKIGFKKFFIFMQELSHDKLFLIYKYIFDIYNPDCFIYQSLNYYIKKNNSREERKFIKEILVNTNDFSKVLFDKTELIKNIILLHLENKNVPLDLIKELIEKIESKKERAILKTLIIDYL